MKDKIHPKYGPVIFRDISCGEEWYGMSTKLDGPKETRDGIDYHVISLEISSLTHPFYSGKNTLIDTTGRVDKFQKRFQSLRSRKAGKKAE